MKLHRGYVPVCIGRIAELHGLYYARTAGFGTAFEAKVATELARFCLGCREDRDGLWLALEDDVIHGAIAIDGSGQEPPGAHLRWFITSDTCRGKGVGTQLLCAALAFCRERSHRTVHLWTFGGLHAARHLYEKHGFVLARTQRGARWGTEVDEQLFIREGG